MAEEIQLAGNALSVFYCVVTMEFLVNYVMYGETLKSSLDKDYTLTDTFHVYKFNVGC